MVPTVMRSAVKKYWGHINTERLLTVRLAWQSFWLLVATFSHEGLLKRMRATRVSWSLSTGGRRAVSL